MTDREKIIKSLKNALNSLDYTSDLRLVLIRTIEYLQEEPHKELYDKLSKLTEDALAKETKESWNEFLDNKPVSEDLEEAAMMHFKNVLERKIKTGLETANMTSFKAGAQWKKQRLMQDAVERVVKIDAGGYPYIDATELYDYDKDKPLAKAGDKVMIVFINGV